MQVKNIRNKCSDCKDFMDRLLKEQVVTLKKENEILREALNYAQQILNDINYKFYNTETDFVEHCIEKAKELIKLKGKVK